MIVDGDVMISDCDVELLCDGGFVFVDFVNEVLCWNKFNDDP